MQFEEKQPLLTPILRWFMFAMVLANIAGSMYRLMLPLYLSELGASIVEVGLVFTITSVVVLLLQIFGGWVSDSIGRLRAIAIGSLGGVVGFFAMLIAPSWGWMIAAISVGQVAYALVGPSFGAFIAENSSEENRGRVYGLTDTIFRFTGVIGPPLGGFLAGAYGFRGMLLVAAVLYTLAAGLRVWMATTMRSPVESLGGALNLTNFKASLTTLLGMLLGGGVLTWIFITDGVGDIAFRLSGELQPLYLEQVAGISVEQIGILGGIFSIAMMATPILSGRMGDRYGERLPIAIGFFMVFIAFMIFLNVSTFLGFGFTWVAFGIGVGMLSPAYQSLISKIVPPKMLGTFTGVFGGAQGFLALPAPWLGAQLWARYTPRLPFAITAAASLLLVIPIWFKFKLPEEPEGDPGAHRPEAVVSPETAP